MNHRLQDDWNKIGKLDRAIVAKRVPILATAGIALAELVRDGVIPDGVSNTITHLLSVGLIVLGVASGAFWAQRGTTPADPQLSPTDMYGNKLVSALSIGPHAGVAPNSATTSDALDAANAVFPMDNPPAAPTVS